MHPLFFLPKLGTVQTPCPCCFSWQYFVVGFIRTLEAQGEPAGANVASRSCVRTSASCASVAEFDERLWGAMVDYVTVGADGSMMVAFRDGTEMTQCGD